MGACIGRPCSGFNVKNEYNFVCISDEDQQSKRANGKFGSHIQHGILRHQGEKFEIEWTNNKAIESGIADKKGRGMELSDAVVVNDKVLTFDDRTGFLFSVDMDEKCHSVAKVDIELPKLKVEWAFVRNDKVIYGSHMNVKRDSTMTAYVLDTNQNNIIEEFDCNAIAKSIGKVCLKQKEYNRFESIVVEAAIYSESREQLIIAPRWINELPFDPKTDDGKHGTNKVFLINWKRDAPFSALEKITEKDVQCITLEGPLYKERGCAALDWVPGTNEEYLASCRSVEAIEDGKRIVMSYVQVFDLEGRIIMEDIRLPHLQKYEGLAFVDDVTSMRAMD